jgi:hypothetical protein
MIVTEVNKQALQRTFARRYKSAKKRSEKSVGYGLFQILRSSSYYFPFIT